MARFLPIVSFEEHLDAFEELVTRHSRGVHRTLVDIVGNVQEVQDAFQGRIQAKV